MVGRYVVDELYAAFVDTLSAPLADGARSLAFTLRLTPAPAIPWSEVFKHEVTLMAPAMIAEAMPGVSPTHVRDATLAHMLAIVEAFGTDRIEDGQVQSTDALTHLLAHVRHARNAALLRVCKTVDSPSLDFAFADQKTTYAIAAERKLLLSGRAADFRTYEAASLGKQSVGFPASLALAHASGWSTVKTRVLTGLLASIWVGLQMNDDVVDWEDDMSHGGAWAVSLMLRAHEERGASDGAEDPPIGLQGRVHDSRVLERMLDRSRRYFRAACRRSLALGAKRLAVWADEREKKVTALLEGERKSPGYAVRAHRLSAWAGEVLT
jgi:hypothetical protein